PGPRIRCIRSPRTPHSLYPLSPDPAFPISALPGPRIRFIRSPRTPHSLYPLSPDPTFAISALPRTPHSLYPLTSPDPAFPISAHPGPCIHYIWSPTVHRTWKNNYFSHYKLL
ncbi:unnamed protein product, partial [Staurois parvus]